MIIRITSAYKFLTETGRAGDNLRDGLVEYRRSGGLSFLFLLINVPSLCLCRLPLIARGKSVRGCSSSFAGGGFYCFFASKASLFVVNEPANA